MHTITRKFAHAYSTCTRKRGAASLVYRLRVQGTLDILLLPARRLARRTHRFAERGLILPHLRCRARRQGCRLFHARAFISELEARALLGLALEHGARGGTGAAVARGTPRRGSWRSGTAHRCRPQRRAVLPGFRCRACGFARSANRRSAGP